jgi:hypothetical protein
MLQERANRPVHRSSLPSSCRRYNLLYVYVRKYESGGSMFPLFFNQVGGGGRRKERGQRITRAAGIPKHSWAAASAPRPDPLGPLSC